MRPTEKPALSFKPSMPSADRSESPFSVLTGRRTRDWACAHEQGQRPAVGSAGPTQQRRPMGPLLGRRTAMAEDKTNRGPDDRSRTYLDDDDGVRYRATQLGISKPQLEGAVARATPRRALSRRSCAKARLRAVDVVGVSLLLQARVRLAPEFLLLGSELDLCNQDRPNQRTVHAARPSSASSRLSASGRCLCRAVSDAAGKRFLHRRHRSARRPFVRPRDPCRHHELDRRQLRQRPGFLGRRRQLQMSSSPGLIDEKASVDSLLTLTLNA